jgi:hypothetical protein
LAVKGKNKVAETPLPKDEESYFAKVGTTEFEQLREQNPTLRTEMYSGDEGRWIRRKAPDV